MPTGNHIFLVKKSKVHIPQETGFALATKANEINKQTKKCTLPTRKNLALGTQCNLYSTDLRWGVASGVMQILGLASGETQILAFLDTNMLV